MAPFAFSIKKEGKDSAISSSAEFYIASFHSGSFLAHFSP
jgi:hypothetical protein